MEVIYLQRGESFVWDSDKAEENVRKQGIDFETASQVLFDPLARFEDATRNDEQREAAIGRAADRILYVVHVSRAKNVIRLISARTVTSIERKRYEESE